MSVKNILTMVFLLAAVAIYAVPFTLHNSSLVSIPLVIPGVMNPNLSPQSDSKVDLAEGQKVYFFYKGKKELLFTVTSELAGKKIDVPQLIADREAELKVSSEKMRKKEK
jgi:hypothetical protein